MTTITFEGESISDLSCGLSREWLVTNGIGGYASGTVAQLATRRYHALLVSAIHPPVQRVAQLVRLAVALRVDDQDYDLSSAEYQDGTVYPQGYRLIRSFVLDDGIPTWNYVIGSFVLRASLWMVPGRNITVLRFKLAAGNRQAELALRPLVAARDHHALQRVSPELLPQAVEVPDGIRMQMGPAQPLLWLLGRGMTFSAGGDWYWNFLLPEERNRGYDYLEDLYQPGTFRISLLPGDSATLIASADDPAGGLPDVDAALVTGRNLAAHAALLPPDVTGERDPRLADLATTLRLASEQFVVRRPAGGRPHADVSILAGYHWFADWGRDAMICLPGLLLSKGDVDRAEPVLRSFLGVCSQGMLPNRFPDTGGAAEYNTADATLWFFQALKQTLNSMDAGRARQVLGDFFPQLQDIILWHQRGTRYGIQVDPEDGLLRAGEAGSEDHRTTQLTWMDVQSDGVVMTPRVGKPVEINALWIGALDLMAAWSAALQQDGSGYAAASSQARASFQQRFWYSDGGYLFDVVDGPDGDDASLRPNQLVALALSPELIGVEQAHGALAEVTRHLLTPYGLRTLSPTDARYRGQCVGDLPARDSAYHQGTVWPWLLGPYADAYRRLYPDRHEALSALLTPFADHLREAGVGSISEIFDGDPPHTPRGCIAQAWSVAELLRIVSSLLE